MKPIVSKVAATFVAATFLPLSFNTLARTEQEQDAKMDLNRTSINQNWKRSLDNENDISDLTTSVSNLQNNIETMDTKIEAMDNHINALDTADIQGIDTRMSDLEASDAHQDERVTINRGDIINLDHRTSTTQNQVAGLSSRVDSAETIANSAQATANTALDRSIETQTALAETDSLLETTTKTANWANYTAEINYKNVITLYGWAEEVTDDYNAMDSSIHKLQDSTNAMNAYIGVLPEDSESDTAATLYKHAAQENLHLGSGAQVGDNLNPDDEGYDEALIKTGMTAVGSNSRADADESTSVGGRSKTLGIGSGAFGFQSVAIEDNTISFGNDYQAAVEGKAEILENNRRLVHVAAGVNPTDAVNMTQHNALSNYAGELHNYISVVDSQGVKNRKNLANTTRDVDATSIYLGILPSDGLSDSRETLIRHANEENIHLGVGAQVGDQLSTDDENYDPNNLKTGMSSFGGYSRADGHQSTALGSNSKALGTNSAAVGANSRAVEDNTVSFGNDFQAATEAQPAHDGNVALPARAAIAANTRRLTHISKGINATDAVNMEQYNSLSNTVDENRDEARSGIAISMATEVTPPAPGKNFSLTIAMAEYEGTSAIGVTGSGRLNNSTTVFLGLGMDSTKDHSAAKVGANFQW